MKEPPFDYALARVKRMRQMVCALEAKVLFHQAVFAAAQNLIKEERSIYGDLPGFCSVAVEESAREDLDRAIELLNDARIRLNEMETEYGKVLGSEAAQEGPELISKGNKP